MLMKVRTEPSRAVLDSAPPLPPPPSRHQLVSLHVIARTDCSLESLRTSTFRQRSKRSQPWWKAESVLLKRVLYSHDMWYVNCDIGLMLRNTEKSAGSFRMTRGSLVATWSHYVQSQSWQIYRLFSPRMFLACISVAYVTTSVSYV
jgi:hypothetical protein